MSAAYHPLDDAWAEIAALKAERDRLLSEADYTHTERDTVVGYLKDKEAEVAALRGELAASEAECDDRCKNEARLRAVRDRLRAALQHIYDLDIRHTTETVEKIARRALEEDK